MRAFVFTDQSLERQAGRFVWLAIDVENEKNAGLEAKLANEGVPTLFVVDARTDTVLRRWLGSATLTQLQGLLDEAHEAWTKGPAASPAAPATAEGTDLSAAEASFAEAERLYGAGNDAEAAKAYESALARAPKDWPRRARAVDALVAALSGAHQSARCVAVAREYFPSLRQTSTAANLAAGGLDCALGLGEDAPTRAADVKEFETRSREVLADHAIELAVDDRSGIYSALVEARQDAGDIEGTRRVAGEWAAYLEGEAARAQTPVQRTVFDPHRLSAYLAMGQPARALPMLEQSERDFPQDYNPPARLAVAYKELGRWDEALAASDRALRTIYGPRTVRVLQTRADINAAKGDQAAARQDVERALAFVQTLPPSGRRDGLKTALERKLAALK